MGYPIVTFGDLSGGIEAEVAGSLATLGAASVLVAALPETPVLDGVVEKLRARCVNTDHVVRVPGEGAPALPDDFDWQAIFADAGWFYFNGLTPGRSESGAATALAAAKAASEEELTVFFDVSYRKTLWNWQEGSSPRELAVLMLHRILPYVDVVIASAEDIALLFRLPEGTAALSLETCCDMAGKLAAEFPNLMSVAILLREQAEDGPARLGAMLYDADSMMAHLAPLGTAMEIVPYKIETEVDWTVGEAAFSAGLIYAMMTSGLDDAPRAIGFAAAMAYLRLTRPAIPTRAEVEAVMK